MQSIATRTTAPTASKLATLIAASTAAAVVTYSQYENKSLASCGGLPVHGV